MQRLREEARTAAKICHPNVCSVFDIGCEADQPYFTMEYIEGKSLDSFVADGKPIPPLVAAKLVMRIAAGLQAAHKQGIIHRDIKPANILVREGMRPVITDFGLAHRSDQAPAPSSVGRVLGSPAYMAPEQVRGDVSQIGPATDVYGLGAILYELITGRRPFKGQVPAIYSQVLKQSPLPPSKIAKGIDARLEAVCLRALSKSPSDRFQTVAAFRRAIAECLQPPRRQVGRAPAIPPRAEKRQFPQPLGSEQSHSFLEDLDFHFNTTRPKKRHPRLGRPTRSGRRTGKLSRVAALALVLIVGAGFLTSVTADQPETSSSDSPTTSTSIVDMKEQRISNSLSGA